MFFSLKLQIVKSFTNNLSFTYKDFFSGKKGFQAMDGSDLLCMTHDQ